MKISKIPSFQHVSNVMRIQS